MQSETIPNENLMLSADCARRVYYSSMLTTLSVVAALQYERYDFALLTAIVLLNSINYWRYPVAGWRRNLDMACAFGACFYHIYASFELVSDFHFIAYWLALTIAVFSYLAARHYGRVYNDPDMASRWHMGLHLFGNLSNVILYYGFSFQ